MTKVFEIIDIEKSNLELDVFLSTGKSVIINRAKFESWLKRDDRLNTELNYSDECGDHIQHSATMSIDEYWQLTDTEINKDIYDYLLKEMESKKAMPFDIFAAMKQYFEPIKFSNHA